MTVSNIAATGYNPPSPMDTMGNMVSLARNVQGYQAADINLQAQRQANQERQNVMALVQNDPDFKPGPDGIIDQAKVMPKLMAAAPQTYNQYAQNINTSNSGNALVNTALTGLDKETRDNLASIAGANVGQPRSVAAKQIQEWMDSNSTGGNKAKVQLLGNKLLDSLNQAGDEQPKVDSVLQTAGLRTKAISEIIAARQPGVSMVNNNQKITPEVTQPNWSGQNFGAVPPGAKTTQIQPSPTTTVYNPKTQQTELLGATGDIKGAGGGITTSPPIGTEQGVVESVGEMARHYSSLNDQSSGAQLIASLSGNIQSLAAKAITGTEQDKKAYVNGMLNALHLGNQATGDLQKDTDLLEKNLAQLNLSTPAATNAVRDLVSIARPHTTMSAASIPEATQQVVSQVQANMAMRNYLTPYRMANKGAGDVVGYQHAREQLEQVADPRVWQYQQMKKANPDAAKKFLADQPDASALVDKAKELVGMGLIK